MIAAWTGVKATERMRSGQVQDILKVKYKGFADGREVGYKGK